MVDLQFLLTFSHNIITLDLQFQYCFLLLHHLTPMFVLTPIMKLEYYTKLNNGTLITFKLARLRALFGVLLYVVPVRPE